MEDVEATGKLLQKMIPYIDFDRELIRGEYMNSTASTRKPSVPKAAQNSKILVIFLP